MAVSTAKLNEYANADLIYPRGNFDYYNKKLIDTIKSHEWNIDLSDENATNDIHQDDLWYDCSALINVLAQMVLDEREKRKAFIKELKEDLKNYVRNLNEKNFENL